MALEINGTAKCRKREKHAGILQHKEILDCLAKKIEIRVTAWKNALPE